MALNVEKVIERSVDSLQKLYAVIVSLAIGFAIQNLLLNRADNSFSFSPEIIDYLPAFFAFLFVIVPFYHGMNRHLDRCYLEDRHDDKPKGALLFDFAVFFFEASILFAVAASIRSGLQPFLMLGILLCADMVWSLVSHWIHYRKFSPSVIRWAIINFAVLVVAPFVVLIEDYPTTSKAWLLLILAVTRAVADYWSCWKFYFPLEDGQ